MLNNEYIEKYLKAYDDGMITLGEVDNYLARGLKTKEITIDELRSYTEKLKPLGYINIEETINFVEYARTNLTMRIFGGIYKYEVIERGYVIASKQEYLDSLLSVIDDDLFYLDYEYKLKFLIENSLYKKVMSALNDLTLEERLVYLQSNREKWPFLDRIIKETTG